VGIRGERPSDREPPLIELLPIEPRAKAVAKPPTTGPSAGPSRSSPGRRTIVVGALVGVIAVVGAIALATGGESGDDTPPRSTASPVTSIVPVSTASISLPSPTNTVVIGTGSLTPTSAPGTAAPGRPQGYTWVSFNRSEMTLVDLDSGERLTYPVVERSAGGTESPIVLADRVVYTSYDFSTSPSTPSVWSQALGADRPVRLFVGAATIAASTRAGHVWIQSQTSALDTYEAIEIDLSGRAVTRLTIPAGLRVAGASADGLWLAGSGRVFAINRAGVVREVASGSLIDTSADAVVFEDCPLAGPCSARVATATKRSLVGPASAVRVAGYGPTDSMLSPDGRWLLTVEALIDRTTSSAKSHSFKLRSWSWSADGEWLFVSAENTDAVAWNLRDLRQVSLGVLGPLTGVVVR
jgi:hypothetical protein